MARRNSILVSKSLYQIGVLTLITSIMWTGFAVMQAINKAPTKIEVDSKVLEPINTNLDKKTLELLSNRKDSLIEITVEPLSTSTESANASSSATINVTGE